MAKFNNFEQAATGFGITSIGFGVIMTLFPTLGSRLFGNPPEAAKQSGSVMAIRALGARDIAFGTGMLLNRNKPEAARQWLRLFALCMAGDTFACLTALRRPGGHFFAIVGGLLSVVYGALAYLAAREE